MINGHGDDLYKYKHIVANFSSNVHQNTDNTSLIDPAATLGRAS